MRDDRSAEVGMPSGSWLRRTFQPDTATGKAAIASALLFVITPSLAFFVSAWFLLLLLPAAALSMFGLRAQGETSEGKTTRMARTGGVMAFDGVLLIVGLFLVGVITDFAMSSRTDLHPEKVAVGFTTVHILVGLGLLLVDHYRHVRQD